MSLLALLAGAPIAAQQVGDSPRAASVGELRTEVRRLEEEIVALRRSPMAPAEWQEQQRIHATLAEMNEQRRKEQSPLQERLDALSRSDGVRTWLQHIATREERLSALRAMEYQETKEDGRRLFQARHAQLAATAPRETPRLRELGLAVLSYPRMDGSTSTQPLATIIACRCLGAEYGWVGREQALPRPDPYDSSFPRRDLVLAPDRRFFRAEPELELLEFTLRARTSEPVNERLALIINGLLAANASTHLAYVNLIEGRSDIGLLARQPSDDERRLAREKRVELDVVPCARDAFVFLVNEANPVRNLTTAQIRAIYAGRLQNWKDIGGPDRRIVPFQREENSGSQELMRTLVMKDVELASVEGRYPPQLIGRLMSSTYLSLTRDEWGIGYSVYYYEQYMSGSPRTRTIAVDGVAPAYESIRDRTYPYVTDVFVVTRQSLGQDSPARRLRDWLLTAEGQSVIRESGYVPAVHGRER